MGGGGGGYFPPIDIAKLTERANQRIQDALQERRVTVFVADTTDVSALEQLIGQSGFAQRPFRIVDTEARLNEDMNGAGLIVFFVDRSEQHAVIDAAIPIAASLRVPHFFVHSQEHYSMPNRVLQFRVRTMPWTQLLEIVIGG